MRRLLAGAPQLGGVLRCSSSRGHGTGRATKQL